MTIDEREKAFTLESCYLFSFLDFMIYKDVINLKVCYFYFHLHYKIDKYLFMFDRRLYVKPMSTSSKKDWSVLCWIWSCKRKITPHISKYTLKYSLYFSNKMKHLSVETQNITRREILHYCDHYLVKNKERLNWSGTTKRFCH